jgi:large subunit ribosomal protein L22
MVEVSKGNTMAKTQNTTEKKQTVSDADLGSKKTPSEFRACVKYLRISPIKVARVAKVVQGKDVNTALQILKQLPQKPAEELYKVLHSAKFNAINNHGCNDPLKVSAIITCAGPQMKRFQPKGRGRIYKILKRTSHIHVVLNALTKGVK